MTLDNSFKVITSFIPFHVLFKTVCFGNNLWNKIFLLSFVREDNIFLYWLYLIWASLFKVRSFNFMYLITRSFPRWIDFCKPRVIHLQILIFVWKCFYKRHANWRLNWLWSEKWQKIDPNFHYLIRLNFPRRQIDT